MLTRASSGTLATSGYSAPGPARILTSEVVVPRAASAAVGAPIRNKAAASSLHGLVMACFLQLDLICPVSEGERPRQPLGVPGTILTNQQGSVRMLQSQAIQ